MRRSGHALTTGFVLLALLSGVPGLLSAGCAQAWGASADRTTGCDHERPKDSAMSCCAAPAQVSPSEDGCCSVSAPGPALPAVPSLAPPTTVPDAAPPAPAVAPAPAHTPFSGVAPVAGPARHPPVPLFTLHAALLI